MSAGTEAETFEDLVRAMRRRPRPLAFLGAGVSVDSGYPTWAGLLAKLKGAASKGLKPEQHDFLQKLGDPAWQAEEYLLRMGDDAFRALLAGEFAPKPSPLGPVAREVAALGFRHLLTTNYDRVMELAYQQAGLELEALDWSQPEKLRQFLQELSYDDDDAGPRLVYLHGRFFDPQHIVLTESSYATRYLSSDDSQLKLLSILLTQPIVFIGFSVNDPDINYLMRVARARLGVGNPHHFAIVGYELDYERELIERRFEGKFGIQSVFYRVHRGEGREDHSVLVELLEDLRQATSAVDRAPTRGSRRARGGRSLAVEEAEPPPQPVNLARSDFPDGSEEETGKPAVDPLDPQKGRWGGLAERHGLRLRADRIHEAGDLCSFDLLVETTPGREEPFAGKVTFHLHQTFRPDRREVDVENQRTVLELIAYGAFTVGVSADEGRTHLELDLAQVEAFPRWFRES